MQGSSLDGLFAFLGRARLRGHAGLNAGKTPVPPVAHRQAGKMPAPFARRKVPVAKSQSRQDWLRTGRQSPYGVPFASRHTAYVVMHASKDAEFLASKCIHGTLYHFPKKSLG